MTTTPTSILYRFVVVLIIIAITAVTITDDAKKTHATKKGSVGEITVLAASSLSDVLPKIGRLFETQNPDASIEFSFGASSLIEPQLEAGVYADVVATADAKTMAVLDKSGLIASEPQIFTHNTFAIAVEKNNPNKIRSLRDLARSNLKVVLCAPKVSCGLYAQRILKRADLAIDNPIFAPDAAAAIALVALGEADAALIYQTEIISEPKVASIAIPTADNLNAKYPAAVAQGTENRHLARAFLKFLNNPTAQRIFDEAGFVSKAKL